MIYKILVLLLILNSCGVEVGNPQQPTPVPVPSGQPIEDSNTLAAISADGINDMNQAIVNTNNSQSSSFALIQGPEATTSCTDNEAGATLEFRISSEGEVERGVIERFKRLVAYKFQRENTVSYSSEESTIICGTTSRVRIPWNDIETLSIDRSFSGEDSRKRTRIADGSLISQSLSIRTGTHQVSITKSAQSESEITINESHKYSINKYFEFLTQDTSGSIEVNVATSDEQPVVISKSRNLSGLQNITIVSGQVTHTFNNGGSLTFAYANFSFDPSSCAPDSGSLTITHNRADDTVRTYEVNVEANLTTISIEGETKILDLDSCSLE
ncbi:MAG: hypothetical protein HRU19_10020 [Pseudobacteriovorax sp.]|nr:hypothetical protein [Pseudobacteriovorax sp.]